MHGEQLPQKGSREPSRKIYPFPGFCTCVLAFLGVPVLPLADMQNILEQRLLAFLPADKSSHCSRGHCSVRHTFDLCQ